MSDIKTTLHNERAKYQTEGNPSPTIMYLGAAEYHKLRASFKDDLRFASLKKCTPLSLAPLEWDGLYVMEVRWPSYIGFGIISE